MFTALLASRFDGATVSRRMWAGIGVALLGTIVLVLGRGGDLGFTAGASLIIGCAVATSVYFVFQRPLVAAHGVQAVTTWSIAIGTAPMLVLRAGRDRAVGPLHRCGAEGRSHLRGDLPCGAGLPRLPLDFGRQGGENHWTRQLDKRTMFRRTLALGSTLFVSPALAAQPLCELPVAGYLTDDAGAPLEGTLDLELRFYADAAPESAPSECRSFSGVTLDRGWLRVNVDVCSEPPAGDCGVVPLDELFADAPGLWVGVDVGGTELGPRIPIGAVPFAVRASDAEALQGHGPDAFEPAGAVADHAADADAHHSSTSDGLDITPRTVTVGDTEVTTGRVDLGPDANDELTAAIVTTLTGGGEADALHGHAGDHTGGGCYTAYGSTTCAEGWTLIHAGYVIESVSLEPDSDGGGDDSGAVAQTGYCVNEAAVVSFDPGTPATRSFVAVGDNQIMNVGGTLRCSLCCR